MKYLTIMKYSLIMAFLLGMIGVQDGFSNPTRFPNGVNNAPQDVNDFMAMYPSIDPTRINQFYEEFFVYTAADWTVTTTEDGTGSASEAIAVPTAGFGSSLLLTNAAGDNDLDMISTSEIFLLESSKRAWFEIKFKTNDATESDIVVGLSQSANLSTTTVTAAGFIADSTDAIFFSKDDGDANIDFTTMKNSTASTSTAIGTLADDTAVTLGFYYNAVDEIKLYVNGVHSGTVVTTNFPNDEALAVVFGIQNGAAAAKTMNVDYVFMAQER